MRGIKFRAWDKEKQIMVYEDENDSSTYWDGVFSSEIELINHILKSKEYELMQYTGLNDIKNREVYEGDIYSDTNYRHGKYVTTYWTVVWDNWNYGFKLIANIEKQYRGEKYREDVDLHLRAITERKMEYAGNIYENPELIRIK